MTPRIDLDDLVVPEILRIFSDSRYPVNEEMVSRCLDPQVGFTDVDWVEAMISYVRTCILHVVDADSTTSAIASAGDYPLDDLPPLPFARVAIEPKDEAGWMVGTESFEHVFNIWAVFISERQLGKIWDCAWYWAESERTLPDMDEDPFKGTNGPFLFWSLHATDDGIKTCDSYDNPISQETHGKATKLLQKFALELVQVISADKVPHEPVGFVSRQQRRQWTKRHPYIYTVDKPRVYYVNLEAAGEQSHEKGDGSRVYHCRWLVRGHWRHYTGEGRIAKKSTWVRAHVKGPVGAPWKGRPVYTNKEST